MLGENVVAIMCFPLAQEGGYNASPLVEGSLVECQSSRRMLQLLSSDTAAMSVSSSSSIAPAELCSLRAV